MNRRPRLAWAFALFLALPPLIAPYGQIGGYTPALHMAAFIEVGVLILFASFLGGHGGTGVSIAKSPIVLPLLLLVAWAVVSLSWAHSRYEGIVPLMMWGAGLVAFFITASLPPEEIASRVPLGLFVSGVAVALLGLAQHYFDFGWIEQHVKPAATFGNRNLAAEYMLLTLPFSLPWLVRPKASLGAALGAALMVVYLLFAYARGAWLGFGAELAVGASVVAIWARRPASSARVLLPRRVWITGALCCLVLLGLSRAGFTRNVQAIGRTAVSIATESGGHGRIAIWANTLAMIKKHPVAGVGMGNWSVHYPLYQQVVRVDPLMTDEIQHANAHNDYLELGSELGLVGVALLLWLAVAACRLSWARLSDSSAEAPLVDLAAVAALAGIGVDAVFAFPFTQPMPVLLICVCLGSLAGGSRAYATWPRRTTLAVTGAACILAAGVFLVQAQWLRSEVHYRKAMYALLSKDFPGAIREGEQAYASNPLRSELLGFVGTGAFKTGDNRRAVAAWERVLEDYPYSAHTLTDVAAAYAELGEPAKAEADLRQVVAMRPGSAMAERNLGVLLVSQPGRSEEGLDHLKRALTLDPQVADAATIRSAIEAAGRESAPRR
jgi:O-antigen ligase